jgi:hypothetical protein
LVGIGLVELAGNEIKAIQVLEMLLHLQSLFLHLLAALLHAMVHV